MRRVILLALLALAMPVGAFANSGVDFADSGTLLGTSSGYALPGSALFALHGLKSGLNTESRLANVNFVHGSGFLNDDINVRLTMNPSKATLDAPTQLSSSESNIVVPEPGTLVLLGTGLVGIAGLLRRKAKRH